MNAKTMRKFAACMLLAMPLAIVFGLEWYAHGFLDAVWAMIGLLVAGVICGVCFGGALYLLTGGSDAR